MDILGSEIIFCEFAECRVQNSGARSGTALIKIEVFNDKGEESSKEFCSDFGLILLFEFVCCYYSIGIFLRVKELLAQNLGCDPFVACSSNGDRELMKSSISVSAYSEDRPMKRSTYPDFIKLDNKRTLFSTFRGNWLTTRSHDVY